MKHLIGKWFLGASGLMVAVAVSAAGAFAANPPECLDHGKPMAFDNQRALDLKKSSPLGVSVRAVVSGRVTRVFPDRNGHAHFEIQMTDDVKSNIEVVYSEDFGDMPNPSQGAQVVACGDFINSYAANNGYPPSPSGAIIHWVHRSNNPGKHDSGYVLLDNVLYGNGPDHGKPRGRGYEVEMMAQ